ncbi:hypothetical protein [Absidia glauca]|uniref:Splicing factor subunit n=1 Tax=Absidia glauca TaxID=4829 RepID=A0A163MDI5_ABSGL|nr:hypothetical protein [Absidia glauca]
MDRLNINSQIEHLQSKYIGTGHADTIKQDTYASILGHNSLLSYVSVAENECGARVKANLLEKMVMPCGPPPAREEQ